MCVWFLGVSGCVWVCVGVPWVFLGWVGERVLGDWPGDWLGDWV